MTSTNCEKRFENNQVTGNKDLCCDMDDIGDMPDLVPLVRVFHTLFKAEYCFNSVTKQLKKVIDWADHDKNSDALAWIKRSFMIATTCYSRIAWLLKNDALMVRNMLRLWTLVNNHMVKELVRVWSPKCCSETE